MLEKKSQSFEDITSNISKTSENKQKKFFILFLKIFSCIISLSLIFIGVVMLYMSNVLIADLNTSSISKDKESLGIASGVIEHNEITNIALFGVDTRSSTSFKGLADSIMVLSIDEVHNKIKLTSIMRDTRVYMGEGYVGTANGYDKINHSYSYGGAELAIKALNSNFGLNIQDYVTVNFNGLANIIDSFGGIDIEITAGEAREINEHLEYLIKIGSGPTWDDILSNTAGGMTHLTGDQAVAYSRIRNIGGDTERVIRQQKVLSTLASKASAISPLDYPEVIQGSVAYCETSLSIDKIIDMASILTESFTIETMSIPDNLVNTPITSGNMENGLWMWTYDTASAGVEINQFIYEEEFDLFISEQTTP